MATTKKSTQAKTKTQPKRAVRTTGAQTKKPASRAVRTSRPAPTSRSATSAKVTRVRTKNPLQQLYFMNAVVFAGLATAAGLLMGSNAYQFVVGYLAKNELASKTSTVFAPAVHLVYDVELRWMVISIMGIAALLSLLLATRLRSRVWRWIDTAIISGLMVEVIALVSGVQDILTLKLMGGMVVLGCLLGWIAEKEHIENNRPARGAFWLSMLAGLLPWLGIGAVAVSTYVYGMVRYSWFVYVLYGTTLAAAVSCAFVLRRRLMTQAANSDDSGQNYAVINLLSRTAFAAILIIGLKK